MRRVVGVLALLAFAALIASFVWPADTKSPARSMMKIDAIKNALEKEDAAAIKAAIADYPPCADEPPVALLAKQRSPRDTGCFAQIANALGSVHGYNQTPLDQASAATAAVVILRDGRGDWIGHSDEWLLALKTGKGDGVDAARLAVARRMVEAAPLVGRKIEEDQDALAAMKAVAGAIPGACPTYWLLGSGSDPSTLPAEHSADHAACVHHDLGRREGPGSTYGSGTFRSLEGSLALWRETERALRLGMPLATPPTAAVLAAKLTEIEKATQAIATKRVEAVNAPSTIAALGEMHAEAGIVLWKDKDAGADGGDDGSVSGDAAAGGRRGVNPP